MPPPGVDGMMSLPRAGCERCADIFSKPDATVWAWLCSCTALTRGTTGPGSAIAASMALGLCIARAALLLVFSLVTHGSFGDDVVGSTTPNELSYENQTIRYASPVA